MVSMKMTTKMKITKKEENPMNEDDPKIKHPINHLIIKTIPKINKNEYNI